MPIDPSNVQVVWAPQPGPQAAYLSCPLPEILFGGARGGGKSDAVLGKWIEKSWNYGKDFNAVLFRREMPQADDLIERAKEIYMPFGAQWREQPRTFVMPNGGRIRFRPLESTADASKYQGQSLSDVAIEEAGNFEDPAPIDMLFGALRSKAGVPIQMTLTANPGGPGQHWIKHRYIDPAPLGMRVLKRVLPNGSSHSYIFIPSRVQDNLVLMRNDPKYIDRLYLVGSQALVKAWLEGDWNVVAGAFFPEFDIKKHVVEPCELPLYWHRFRSFDWGSARPFACHWWAVSDGELPRWPRGAMICYREWYGAAKDALGETIPNTGLRLTAEEIADGILRREDGDLNGNRVMGGVADPSIFTQDGGPSHADRMAARKVYFREADNTRVPRLGAMGGWDQVRARLKGDGERPAIYFFSTCKDLIRTLPALQHDRGRVEDVDTDGEDHAGDSCFVGDTFIVTKRGDVAIQHIRVGELVKTRRGYAPVTAVFSIGERDVYRVGFSDGSSLVGTANHPIWVVGTGFTPLHLLRYGHILLRPSWSIQTSTERSLEESGAPVMGRFLRSITSIIEMVTHPTMTWLTLSASWVLSTFVCTWQSVSQFLFFVRCAGRDLPVFSAVPVFVPMPARRNGGVMRMLMTYNGYARGVARSSLSIGSVTSASVPMTVRLLGHMRGLWRNIVAGTAGKHSRRGTDELSGAPTVVSEPTIVGKQKVYNLSVEGVEEYFANGILVHNCRYACMSRPYTAPLPAELEPERDRYGRRRRSLRVRAGSGWAA